MEAKTIDMHNIRPEDYGMIATINDTYSAIVIAMIEELHKMKLIPEKRYIFKVSPNCKDYWIEMTHMRNEDHGDCIQIQLIQKEEMH